MASSSENDDETIFYDANNTWTETDLTM